MPKEIKKEDRGEMEAPQSMFRPACAEDWEPYRDIITSIYSNNTLSVTMDEMKATHFFSATAKQYKNKIKEWGLDNKYVKDYEYENLLQLPPQNEYIVRDKVVTSQDLARYKRRKEKSHKKHAQDGTASEGNGEGSSGGAGGSYADQYIDYSGAGGSSHQTTAGGSMSEYGSSYVYDASGMSEGEDFSGDAIQYPDSYGASGTSWGF